MNDLELLVEMIRSVVDDPAVGYRPARSVNKAEIRARAAEAKRLAQLDADAAAVLAWAAPRFASQPR